VALSCLVVGDSGVGKSALLHRYFDGEFDPKWTATIGVDYRQAVATELGAMARFTMYAKYLLRSIFMTLIVAS
jgi:GTPase SAR1 family protein